MYVVNVMILIKTTLLLASVVSFTYSVQANSVQAKVFAESVKKALEHYRANDIVLFYIGKHIQTDRVVIWGQTAISEAMAKILINRTPDSVVRMEEVLRSRGNRWRGNYKNYQLYEFFVSKPGQRDVIYTKAVRNSPELQLLDGYVDRVEKVEGEEIFLDVDGREVLPVKKINGGITECAVADGNACRLLREATGGVKDILAYFEKHMDELGGDGIFAAEMAEALGISSLSLGQRRIALQKKLPVDHFIQRIENKIRHIDGTKVTVYRFDDAVTDEDILAYFEEHKAELNGVGIVIAKMAEALGTNSNALGRRRTKLQEKLPEGHFIQRIEKKIKTVDGKNVTVYRFDDAVTDEDILAYFEEHKAELNGVGIVIAKMAKALRISSLSLGQVLSGLKNKLPKDHFIQRIEGKKTWVDGKNVTVYRFDDAVTATDKDILAYFEEHMDELGDGIVIAEMVEALGINSYALGKRRTNLQRKLPEGHFIQRIESERRYVDGKNVTVYRFDDAVPSKELTTKEKEMLAYFEEHKAELDGDGIVIAEMAEALGINIISLGKRRTNLQRKLPEGHFIQRVKSEQRTVDGKRVIVFRFDDAVTATDKDILAYFEEHKAELGGDGIVAAEMAEALGISSLSLGKRVSALKNKLSDDPFIQRIENKIRHIDGTKVTVFRFDDALTATDKDILAYFEEHMDELGDGIVIAEMAEALGTNSYALGKRKTKLQEKLPEGHFIQRVKSEQRTVDGKRVIVFRFDDAVTDEDILAYFEERKDELGGDGIVIAKMAEALGISSLSLGKRVSALKNKLSDDPFIQRIESERRRVDGKYVTFYRFDDAGGEEQLRFDL